MKYLITGGAGFVGSHLSDALVRRGDDVVVLDDLTTGSRANIAHLLDNESFRFVEGSALDEPLVDDLVRDCDVCFHLASAVGVQLVVGRALDTLLRNVRGNDIVMEAVARHDRRLLFTSTSEIYGKNGSDNLGEDADRIVGSPAKSRWSYATAKAFGEALAHSYYRERGVETVVVRLFNTVGPRQTGQYGMVVPRFVNQALAGKPLTVYGDGRQSRCFTHIHDVVGALLALCDNDLATGNCYNIGAPLCVPVLELAERVIERTGSDSKIVFVRYEDAYGDGFEELARRVPDTTALRMLTGWEPTRTLDDVITDVVAYERTGRFLAESEELVA